MRIFWKNNRLLWAHPCTRRTVVLAMAWIHHSHLLVRIQTVGSKQTEVVAFLASYAPLPVYHRKPCIRSFLSCHLPTHALPSFQTLFRYGFHCTIVHHLTPYFLHTLLAKIQHLPSLHASPIQHGTDGTLLTSHHHTVLQLFEPFIILLKPPAHISHHLHIPSLLLTSCSQFHSLLFIYNLARSASTNQYLHFSFFCYR